MRTKHYFIKKLLSSVKSTYQLNLKDLNQKKVMVLQIKNFLIHIKEEMRHMCLTKKNWSESYWPDFHPFKICVIAKTDHVHFMYDES